MKNSAHRITSRSFLNASQRAEIDLQPIYDDAAILPGPRTRAHADSGRTASAGGRNET
jgi:hypothetical protein